MDRVTGSIIDAAVRLHARLGPGLLESVYETLLDRELSARGLRVERQKCVDFEFEGLKFRESLRVDLLVERCVVVEVKSIEQLAPVHRMQVLTYLRLLDLRVGLLINFGQATLKAGLRRVVNNYVPPASLHHPQRLREEPGHLPAESPKTNAVSGGSEATGA